MEATTYLHKVSDECVHCGCELWLDDRDGTHEDATGEIMCAADRYHEIPKEF